MGKMLALYGFINKQFKKGRRGKRMANGRIKQIAGKIMLGAFAAAVGFSVLSNLPWAV